MESQLKEKNTPAPTIVAPQTPTPSPTPNTPARETVDRAAIVVPSINNGCEARDVWKSVLDQVKGGEVTRLDMSNIKSLDQATTAALMRFLKAADRRGGRIQMIGTPRKTHALLELLGVHHIVDIRADKHA